MRAFLQAGLAEHLFSSTAIRHLARLLRLVVISAVSGLFAGAIAGGIGSRIVMRIVALADRSSYGLVTENGNIIGEITFGGTLDLVGFAAFLGMFVGIFYALVRRWLPGSGLWKGLSLGAFLLLLAHGFAIDPENPDFRILDPPALSISLFALLPFFYGLLLSPIVERFDRYVPPVLYRAVPTAAGYLTLAGFSTFGLVLLVQDVSDILS